MTSILDSFQDVLQTDILNVDITGSHRRSHLRIHRCQQIHI
jgi:hypothetical protein